MAQKKESKKSINDYAPPWLPPSWELADSSALKALERGDANQDQQQRALKWILNSACATYDMSYRPGGDGDRDTAFAEGRRFVGLNIVKLLKLNPALFRRTENG